MHRQVHKVHNAGAVLTIGIANLVVVVWVNWLLAGPVCGGPSYTGYLATLATVDSSLRARAWPKRCSSDPNRGTVISTQGLLTILLHRRSDSCYTVTKQVLGVSHTHCVRRGQFMMVSTPSGKPVCATTDPSLRFVPIVAFDVIPAPGWSDWRWPFLVLSRMIVLLRLSINGDMFAGSVSRPLRQQCHLLWLFCPPVCLLGH